MQNPIAVLLASLAATAAAHPEFAAFKKAYGKTYASPAEEARRLTIFLGNRAENERIIRASDGLTYEIGVTQFSDLTRSEFAEQRLMKHARRSSTTNQPRAAKSTRAATRAELEKKATLPASIDWTAKNAVTQVMDQGQCGSCWVFSATGALEGARAIASNFTSLVKLSEEEYMQCYGAGGASAVCNGGDFNEGFIWASKHAICTESAGPYIAPTGKPYPPPPKLVCNMTACADSDKVGIPQGEVIGHVYVPMKSEAALMAAVALGPVSVSVFGGALQNYRGGVMSGQCMTAQHGDHAMLVVGYGTDAATGLEFWKIKNSYGTAFGESGFMRLKRNDSVCGGATGLGGIGILSGPGYPQVVYSGVHQK